MTRPVVFVHGVRTSSAIWARQRDAVVRRGHQAITVDLPGHGSRAGERFTVDRALQVIHEAVRSVPVPPLVVGLSLGGYLSLAYAARHQKHIGGLVLSGCSTEIRGKPVGTYRRIAHHANGMFRLGGPTWHIVTDVLTAMRGYSPLTDLRRLHVPVWLVNGRRDPLRLDERRMLGARPGTTLQVVRNAGHDVNSHAPQAFNRVLLDVLHRLSGEPSGATEASGAPERGPGPHGAEPRRAGPRRGGLRLPTPPSAAPA